MLNQLWNSHVQLPNFSDRHPVLGLIISVAILFIILKCITSPFQVLRLLFRLFIRTVDGVAAASGSISAVKGPLPGPTIRPPIRPDELKGVAPNN